LRLRLSLLMFLQWAVPGALLPLYSTHLDRELGFEPMDAAACCATQAAATVLSSLLAGQVADRWFSAERALAVCAALAGVDLWVLAGLHSFASVFAATLVFWLLIGPAIVLGTTIGFTNLERPEQQFPPVRMWGTAGWMVTGWLIGVLAWLLPGFTGVADAFRLGGVLAFVLAGYALTLPHTPPRRGGGVQLLAPLAALKLLRGEAFAVYAVCVVGTCITFPFTTQNTPLLLVQRGVPREWLQPALTVAQTTEVLFLGLLPMLLLRLGVRGTMMLGLSAWTLALGVLALGRRVELLVASQALNGLYIAGFLVAGQVYANALAAGDLRASVQGLFSFVNGLGQLAGNLLAGWLRERAGGGLEQSFAVGAAITAGLLLVFVVGFRHSAPAAGGGPGASHDR
jgi:MFS family permease